MLKIAIIIGSTRPGRNGEAVAKWVYELAKKRTDASFELIDLKDFNLPLLDEPLPPSMGSYQNEHTKAWSKKIAQFDGYVFVTPEYNHTIPASLKNALDYLYAEWNDKSAGFVGYGSMNGIRSVEHLRQIAGQLRLADVSSQVGLSLYTDFENMSEFKPQPRREKEVEKMLGDVIAWGGALKALREAK
ncbi:MAG: NAD(P)H-dependent oxidoreductase [Clostridiaceae bacterium]|nr:NAD(P)H-dependent oxidoreductase [Eubacteriales bacterium]